jgi:hypothetical protein
VVFLLQPVDHNRAPLPHCASSPGHPSVPKVVASKLLLDLGLQEDILPSAPAMVQKERLAM